MLEERPVMPPCECGEPGVQRFKGRGETEWRAWCVAHAQERLRPLFGPGVLALMEAAKERRAEVARKEEERAQRSRAAARRGPEPPGFRAYHAMKRLMAKRPMLPERPATPVVMFGDTAFVKVSDRRPALARPMTEADLDATPHGRLVKAVLLK